MYKPNVYNFIARPNVDYWILNTDYDNYAYVYGCEEQNGDGTCKQAHAWIWSRTHTLTEEHKSVIDASITESCLDPAQFTPAVQEKCKI